MTIENFSGKKKLLSKTPSRNLSFEWNCHHLGKMYSGNILQNRNSQDGLSQAVVSKQCNFVVVFLPTLPSLKDIQFFLKKMSRIMEFILENPRDRGLDEIRNIKIDRQPIICREKGGDKTNTLNWQSPKFTQAICTYLLGFAVAVWFGKFT